MEQNAQRLEVEKNYDYFCRNLHDYLENHRDEYVLLRNESEAGFYKSVSAANNAGHNRFGDKPFSIQEVTEQPIDLGFFSL